MIEKMIQERIHDMEQKNVLLVLGISQYEAMRNYIEEIAVGFRLAGYNTLLVDVKESSYDFQIEEIKHNLEVHIIFTCNAIESELDLKTIFPNAYFLTYLCDHPTVHLKRLSYLNERSIVFTCDKRHEVYIKRYCKNIKYTKYIPLSGSYCKKYVPYNERTRDIVFTGSYSKPEVKYDSIFRYEGVLLMFAKYMVQQIIEEPDQDLEMCLENALNHFNVPVTDEEFYGLVNEFRTVDQYARIYYRDKMIRSLLENGLKVHVFGNGWETFEGEGKENLIIEKGDFYIAQKAVADAKISVNIMPWFKAGFQERIATAMLSGAVAVTDGSNYILDNFTDGQEMVLYSLKNLEELPVKIKYLLEHLDEAEEIAQRGRKMAEETMTWQHRTFEMIDYMQDCFELYFTQEVECGETLQINYTRMHERRIGVDTINNLKEILSMIQSVQSYDKIELCDINYFYTKFLTKLLKAKANYPEINISEYISLYLMNLSENQINVGIQMLIRECTYIMSQFLQMERNYLLREKQEMAYQLKQVDIKPNMHSQNMLIKKIKSNYSDSQDKDIQESLANIEMNNCVNAYNQNFVRKYGAIAQEEWEKVQYDSEAKMYYAIWNGKKMYYPRGYTKDNVVFSVNFVKLEQDENSPHRYLDATFDVQEGDIVIDAGVAEGNFALDVIEKVKKVYLVECEHKWVEALEKTFEPWADKVVIIEKMLGDKNEEQFVSIDQFVEEGYVNFIKMDVEGEEIPSLIGASKVLQNSKNIKCAICSYHRKNAEKDIRQMLEEQGFFTTVTKGYMFFKEDMDSWIDGEFRRGLVRGVKREEM